MLRASVKKFVCKLVQKRAGGAAKPLSHPSLRAKVRFFGQKVVKLLRKVYINFVPRAGEIRLQAPLLLFTHQLESLSDG